MGLRDLPRGLRVLFGLGLCGLLIGLAFLLCLVLHYHNTPDFDAYLRTRPVVVERAKARWPEGELLSPTAQWRIGEVDPFALDDKDPLLRRHALRFTATIAHGDEVLAKVVQEVAIAVDRATGERQSAAVRMDCPQRDPRIRVIARIWLEDENLIGPGSLQKGHAIFDAMVVAGDGPNEWSVARKPNSDLPPLDPSDPEAEVGGVVLPVFDPGGKVAESGMIYHVRRSVWLAWTDSPTGSQSAGFEALRTWMSTDEYSYSIVCKVEDAGWTSTDEKAAKLSWNGRVW